MSDDLDAFRSKAREYAVRAQTAKDHQEWRSMTLLARSHVLLEINARWLASTEEFLEAVNNNQPWPGPDAPESIQGKKHPDRLQRA